jgi:hypothetical protein
VGVGAVEGRDEPGFDMVSAICTRRPWRPCRCASLRYFTACVYEEVEKEDEGPRELGPSQNAECRVTVTMRVTHGTHVPQNHVRITCQWNIRGICLFPILSPLDVFRPERRGGVQW